MKNNFLFCVTFMTASMALASEFVPQRFEWTYSVQPKDVQSFEHFVKFNDQMSEMVQEINRGPHAGIYQQFVVFMKELQEAIAAGFNLVGSAMTTQAPITEVVAEVAQAVVDDVVSQDEIASDVVKSETEILPVFSITLTCALPDENQRDLWNLATTMLNNLCEGMNDGSLDADHVVDALNNVYDVLMQMRGSGISLTSCAIAQN
ncbi:hypothetical protein A3J41_01855 [candidate division TM6 bacterium RIFCSPHIGHO2_12_FULL_38_8]|nr:MAG: hypothetical protein A3J41_01855 [candidate division TM6 bacterium RIFCSPHIGHO2_12_FULL_38_8]